MSNTTTKSAKEKKITSSHDVDRLERYLAHQGICSRREAKRYIQSGLVSVNGVVCVKPGKMIDPKKDTVSVDIKKFPEKEVYALYKPRGIETNKTFRTHKDIHDIAPKLKHLAPIGRLDKESEGLIILSNDGLLAKKLTTTKSVEKEYVVSTKEKLDPKQLRRMEKGILVEGSTTLPCVIQQKSDTSFSIVLTEGRNRQIRRMCRAVRLTVLSLVRTRIDTLTLDTLTLKSGAYKKLTQKDVTKLKSTTTS